MVIKKNKMEKQKISRQFVLSATLLIVVLVCSISLMLARKHEIEQFIISKSVENKLAQKTIAGKEKNEADIKKDIKNDGCKVRYYDGEAQISAWIIKQENQGKPKVKIKREDLEKLPTNNADLNSSDFVATLVDPTEEILNELQDSDEENPVNITIRGFANNCSDLHQLSINQATIAFKQG